MYALFCVFAVIRKTLTLGLERTVCWTLSELFLLMIFPLHQIRIMISLNIMQ